VIWDESLFAWMRKICKPFSRPTFSSCAVATSRSMTWHEKNFQETWCISMRSNLRLPTAHTAMQMRQDIQQDFVQQNRGQLAVYRAWDPSLHREDESSSRSGVVRRLVSHLIFRKENLVVPRMEQVRLE
jgi:hypothetical protein